MDFLIPVSVIAAVLAVVALFALTRLRGLQDELTEQRVRATEAETRIGAVGAQLVDSNEARERLAAALEAAKAARHEAEKQTALAHRDVETMKERVADWDKTKDEAMAAARSAMLSTATDLSNKLLEDHKREAKTAKEEGEKRIKQESAQLLLQVETLTRTVSSLNDQVGMNRDAVSVIERALSNPAGAGFAAETVLENTLKSFGLAAGTDFVLQRSFGAEDGGRLRPDAIVFLPADSVLVIDSKASKYLIELARADDDETEAALYGKLAVTMNNHLRSLAGKNYRTAVQADYREAGKGGEVRQLISLMWLPNDAAVEKVLRADPDFQRKASENGIFVVGPTGLWTAVGVAGSRINMSRQAENHEKIVDAVHALIDSLATVLTHAGRVGSGVRSAVKAYDDFSRSINRRVLPRARKLLDLGIEPPTKGLPKPLPSYQVVDTEAEEAAEPEVEVLDNIRELPLPKRD